MIETLLRDLRQPEYIHVLINPLPTCGLAMGWIGLVMAFFLKSRRAQIATLALVFISAASAWPVYELGQQSYDRVLSMADTDGQAWLDEHQDRAQKLIYFFYALALLSATAIVVPMKWPKSSMALTLAVIVLGSVVIGTGAYIAQAGAQSRPRALPNRPPATQTHTAEAR